MSLRFVVLALAALWPMLAAAGERWRVEYFYDPPDGTEFAIAALAFPSAQHGMAAGAIVGRRKPKPYAVTTSDGGKTWTPVAVPEEPISLFFLNDNTGWLLAPSSLWRTDDFGQRWNKLKPPPGALKVYFQDEKHGWAVGDHKSVFQTSDGGTSWTPVAAAAKPETTVEHTVYSDIAFARPKDGLIVGWSRPSRPGERNRPPDWIDPAAQPREWPGLGISLQTLDGGVTWKATETSMFGQPTALSMGPDGQGLLLVEFFGRFDYPSEVYRVDLVTGKSTRAFRRKDRAVTDVLAIGKGVAYLAAVEPPGSLFHSPVPGKLKLLKSEDLENWTEMDVDYRANAREAVLAAPDPQDVWVATDTGMILKKTTE